MSVLDSVRIAERADEADFGHGLELVDYPRSDRIGSGCPVAVLDGNFDFWDHELEIVRSPPWKVAVAVAIEPTDPEIGAKDSRNAFVIV